MCHRGPEYDLAEVAACLIGGEVVVATRSASEMISAHLGLDRRAATALARRVVALLEPRNYSGTVLLREGPADEYGIVVDGVSWYVKLHLDRLAARLHIISCHLPDRDIHTVEGIVTCTQRGVRPYA